MMPRGLLYTAGAGGPTYGWVYFDLDVPPFSSATQPYKMCLKSPWTVVSFSHIINCIFDYRPEGRLMQYHR